MSSDVSSKGRRMRDESPDGLSRHCPEAAWATLAFVVLLFACVVAHEFGHIFTARAFGVPTTDAQWHCDQCHAVSR